jgi:hypothetical protein
MTTSSVGQLGSTTDKEEGARCSRLHDPFKLAADSGGFRTAVPIIFVHRFPGVFVHLLTDTLIHDAVRV